MPFPGAREGRVPSKKSPRAPGPGHALRDRVKRRLSDETILVTCDDGTRFRCSVSTLARESDPCWVLMDANGAQFIGPPLGRDRSPEAIHRQINDWWNARKETASPPEGRDTSDPR